MARAGAFGPLILRRAPRLRSRGRGQPAGARSALLAVGRGFEELRSALVVDKPMPSLHPAKYIGDLDHVPVPFQRLSGDHLGTSSQCAAIRWDCTVGGT